MYIQMHWRSFLGVKSLETITVANIHSSTPQGSLCDIMTYMIQLKLEDRSQKKR